MGAYVCSNCGAEARVVTARKYQFRETPLKRVYLCGIHLIKCDKCKNVDPIIPELDDLLSSLAHAVTNKRSRLKGDEIRFLRKYVGKTQAQFARILELDPTTISKYENDDDVPGAQTDRLIRLVAIGLGVTGNASKNWMADTVGQFENIEDVPRASPLEYESKTGEVQYAGR